MTPTQTARELLERARKGYDVSVDGDVLASLMERLIRLEEEMEKIKAEAVRCYNDDVEKLDKAPAGNPGNCWAEHTKHTQTFSWIIQQTREALKGTNE